MRWLLLTFAISTIISFVGFVNCKMEKEKDWFIALLVSATLVVLMFVELS